MQKIQGFNFPPAIFGQGTPDSLDDAEVQFLCAQFKNMFIDEIAIPQAQREQAIKKQIELSDTLFNSHQKPEVVQEVLDDFDIDLTAPISRTNLDSLVTAIMANARKNLEQDTISEDLKKKTLKAYQKEIQKIKSLPEGSRYGDLLKIIMQASQCMTDALKKSVRGVRSKLNMTSLSRKIEGISATINKLFEAKLKRIAAILRLESKEKTRQDLVSGKFDKEIDRLIKKDEEIENQKREEKFRKLAYELSVKEKKAKSKAIRPQEVKAAAAQIVPHEESVESSDLSRSDESSVQIDQTAKWRFEHIQELLKRKSRPELPRVTMRWNTTSIEEIRAFTDKKLTGEKVKRYERLSEKEILKWRAFHYLPGTEKIFANKLDKQIYCFTPPRGGIGMIGDLVLPDGTRYHGTLNFGFDAGGSIKHRCYEPIEVQHLDKALILEPEGANDVPETKEQWQCSVPYSFAISEKGVITVEYEKFGHSISIHPLRPDLLATHYGQHFGLA